MPNSVSTSYARRHVGEILDRIALGDEEFIVERRGRPVAALVSVERYNQMQRCARLQALSFMRMQSGGELSERAAEALSLEAQSAVRRARTDAAEGGG